MNIFSSLARSAYDSTAKFLCFPKKLIFFLTFSLSTMAYSNEKPHFSGTLHCIGDSHLNVFTGMIESVSHQTRISPINPPGSNEHPATMYLVGRDKAANVVSSDSYEAVKDGDALLFSYGYIDVNWLIWTQVNVYKRDLEEVVNVLVGKYLDAIFEITAHVNAIKIIYNVIPPLDGNFPTPYVGSAEDRVLFSRKINEELKKECEIRNVEFLDTYLDFCDDRGMLGIEFGKGDCHIDQACNQSILEKLSPILRKYSNE